MECVVGGVLFLGPFVFALTIPGPTGDECEAPTPIVCEVVEPEPVPEPASEPEPTPAPEPQPAPQPEPAPASEPAPEFPAPLLLIDSNYLILDGDADPEWGEGELFDSPVGVELTAAKRANLDRIPASLLNLRGSTYDIYDRQGKRCTATVGELDVVAQYGGDTVDDLFEVLDENLEPIEEQPEVSDAEIRAKIWETQHKWLAGRLVFGDGCEDTLWWAWACDASLPPPVVLTEAREPTPLGAARLEQFRVSKAMREMEAAYREWQRLPENADQDTWEQLTKYDEPQVRSWIDAEGRDRVVELDSGGASSCVDFVTMVTSVEELVDGEFVKLDQSLSPVAVFDADLDGRLEYLYAFGGAFERSLEVVSQTEQLRRSVSISHDFYCPC